MISGAAIILKTFFVESLGNCGVQHVCISCTTTDPADVLPAPITSKWYVPFLYLCPHVITSAAAPITCYCSLFATCLSLLICG